LGAFFWHKRKTVHPMFRRSVLAAGILCYLLPVFHFDFLIVIAGCTLLIFAVVLYQDAAWVKWLDIRPLRYLGKVSYGIYVWQCFFITTGPNQIKGWPLPFPWNLILLCIAVPLSWELIEKRFLTLKERIGYSDVDRRRLS